MLSTNYFTARVRNITFNKGAVKRVCHRHWLTAIVSGSTADEKIFFKVQEMTAWCRSL